MESSLALVMHNVLAIRAEPTGNGEQVSQAVLGDNVVILEERGDYARIRTADEYEGWALCRHLHRLDTDPRSSFFALLINETRSGTKQVHIQVPFANLLQRPVAGSPPHTRLTLGSTLTVIHEQGEFVKVFYPTPNNVSNPNTSQHDPADNDAYALRSGYLPLASVLPVTEHLPLRGKRLQELAMTLIGTPYLWGGTTPFGFDCSGLVQRLFAMCGIRIPRDAYQQACSPLGIQIPEEETPKPRDLVFFLGPKDPRDRGITHVGLALGQNRFLHAYGKDGVTIHTLDAPEITSTYLYRGAWRYRNARAQK